MNDLEENNSDWPDGEDPAEDRLDELVAEYVDRLTVGEMVDKQQILRDHPDLGRDLLDRLEVFHTISPSTSSEPLGTLGDYTLRRQIGRGGMGVVYEAWENSMDRAVALKVLPTGAAADEKIFNRFMREARTAGVLSHPSVVPVYGVGIKERTPYYAMELVQGETLAQVFTRIKDAEPETETPFGKKDRPAYFERLAEALADVADGLQHAHSKGVTHRDIKPSNLILDGEGRLRILDFGLARLEGQESLTVSGDFVGTPLYMSPEQARCKKIPVDHRTDVYSLGATTYEAVCGSPPFRGKDHADTLSQIIERDPVEPREVNPRVPKDLETIVLKCLRKNARDRYGTAEALAQDLRRLVRGDPIEARPQTTWERGLRAARRQRKSLGVAVLLTALVVVLGWLAYAKRSAERETARAGYDEGVLRAVTKILAGRFSLEVGTVRSTVISTRASSFNPLTATELRALLPEDALQPLEEAVSELRQLTRALRKRRDGHYHLARACWLLGRGEEAARAVHEALRLSPEFLPARVLAWELEGKPGGLEGPQFEAVARDWTGTSRWQEHWLTAYRSVRQERWTAAVEAYTKLIALRQPPYIGSALEAYLGRGAAYLTSKDPSRAQADFAAARALAPSLEPTVLLAKAYWLDDKKELARETFEELYRGAFESEKDATATWIAAVCHSLRDHELGLAWARRLESAAVKERLEANFLLRIGRIPEAIVAGRGAIARNPRDPIAHLLLGLAWFEDLSARAREGPVEAAELERLLALARTAVELDPESWQVRSLLRATDALQSEIERRNEQMYHDTPKVITVTTLAMALAGTAAAQHGGFFENEHGIDELNTREHHEYSPYPSSDGRELFFIRDGDLWVATREDAGDTWGSPRALAEINSPASEGDPCVSADGTRLYFYSTRPGGKGRDDLYVATREPGSEPGSEWGNVEPLDELNTPSYDFNPRISPDGKTLYFCAHRPGGAGEADIWVATRDRVADAEGHRVPFANLEPLNEINTPYRDFTPMVSSDGLTIFWYDYGGNYPTSQLSDIYCATRDRVADGEGNRVPFGPKTRLPAPVNSVVHDGEPAFSADWPASGSKLYFTRCSADCANSDLYVATWRLVLRPVFLRGDCNDDGTVDISDAVFHLAFNFVGGAAPPCHAACDANADGEMDGTADPIYTLSYRFRGGPPPPSPFPTCARETLPPETALGCSTVPINCP